MIIFKLELENKSIFQFIHIIFESIFKKFALLKQKESKFKCLFRLTF